MNQDNPLKKIFYAASRTGKMFHRSNAFVRGLMGPVGSGKSVCCVMEILRRAMEQMPDPEGVRRSRWAVIRNTYPELKATTIKTFQAWIPEEVCPITYSSPIQGKTWFRHHDGTFVEMEVLFVSMDKAKDAKKVLSLDITGAWINEVREIPKTIVDAVIGRCGRYPSGRLGIPTWSGVIMDTNPPDDLSWYYHLAEEETPDDWEFFRQPGGLVKVEHDDGSHEYKPNPLAENLENLPEDYYSRQAKGAAEAYIDVMCCAEYKPMFDGKPVYKGSWNSNVHAAKESLEYLPGIPLILGWDFGRTPACVIGQAAPDGQLRILDECYSDDSGVRAFAENQVLPLLARRFPGCRIESFGDPAGAAKGQANEESCFSELEVLGIPTVPACTNEQLPRIEAVIKCLNRMIGGRPGFIVDPRCKRIIRGFEGGYNYAVVGKLMGGGEVKYAEVPVKNSYSHIADALQYLCLGFSPDRIAARTAAVRQIQTVIRKQQSYQYNPLAL